MALVRARSWFAALVLALPAFGLTACGGAQGKPDVKPGPPIAGLNMSGLWYSPQFGDMELAQNGPKVTGTYKHPRGPEHDGTVRGEIVGDLLRIEWIQPGDASAGVFPLRGKAYFRIIENGRKLDGRWGYDDDDYFGGPWTAQKSAYE
jgi:hypothetical protein